MFKIDKKMVESFKKYETVICCNTKDQMIQLLTYLKTSHGLTTHNDNIFDFCNTAFKSKNNCVCFHNNWIRYSDRNYYLELGKTILNFEDNFFVKKENKLKLR